MRSDVFNAFFTFKSHHFVAKSDGVRASKDSCCFKGLSTSWGDVCNVRIESKCPPFYFYIHFIYIFFAEIAACYEHEYRREILIHTYLKNISNKNISLAVTKNSLCLRVRYV